MYLKNFKLLFILLVFMFLGTGINAQYYYFDSGTTTYPYQQGCSEDLYVRINTQGTGIIAGLLQLFLDPLAYFYNNSDTSSILQSSLFLGSTQTFNNWTSPTGTPSWISGSNHTLLQIDRNNGAVAYNGSNGLYGTLKFIPLYSISNGNVSIDYTPGDTTKTSLSVGGVNKINTAVQNTNLTGSYSFIQEPCVADTNIPSIILTSPSTNNKISYLSGITLNLNDAAGVNGANVPYVWTGGHTVWTGNPGGTISNQYGIDPATFVLNVSGNGTGKTFTQADGVLITGVTRTWQDNISNYGVLINSASLFDFGIERTITITGTVKDRNNNTAALLSYSFNSPVGPTLIPGSQSPLPGAIYVNLSTAVKLGVQDEWAGVDSGSIQVTLSGINGTAFGPIIYSGASLGLTELSGDANISDYNININHIDFPTSGTIRVSITAYDLAGTIDTISDYSFTTRPDCSEFQCCNPIDIDIKGVINPYVNKFLYISGGINPYFSGSVGSNTGYLFCGTENNGLSVYSGSAEQSGSAVLAAFFDGGILNLSGQNVVAYVTGANNDTIMLIRFGNFVIKVYPGSRPGGDFSNNGELRLFDMSKNPVMSGILASNSAGTGQWLDNVPSGTYYIVYKGQSHLASYLSGVTIVQGAQTVLDFTTGTNLYNVQNVGTTTDDGNRYQIAGDMRNIEGKYDFIINGNDISAIVYGSGLVELGIDVLDPKNLNGDDAINGFDIGIVGINFQLKDPFVEGPLFTW